MDARRARVVGLGRLGRRELAADPVQLGVPCEAVEQRPPREAEVGALVEGGTQRSSPHQSETRRQFGSARGSVVGAGRCSCRR